MPPYSLYKILTQGLNPTQPEDPAKGVLAGIADSYQER